MGTGETVGQRGADHSVTLSQSEVLMLDTFWHNQGVERAAHRARLVEMAQKHLLFRQPPRLASQMAILRHTLFSAVGLADVNLGMMVGRYPRVLMGDTANTIGQKLVNLRKLMPYLDLRRLVERNPHVLHMDINSVIAKIQALRQLLPEADLLNIIDTHPPLLGCDIENTVAYHFEDLRALLEISSSLPQGSTQKVVEAMPRLLTSDIGGTTVVRWRRLLEIIPEVEVLYADKPASIGRLLCASEAGIERLAFMRECHPDHLALEPGGKRRWGHLSPIRVVTDSRAVFCKKYPDFLVWENEQMSRRRARIASRIL